MSDPPGFHLPFPGFIHFEHFMPQQDINALHHLASKLWVNRGWLDILEVGSFTGASALALVGYAKSMTCVDTWAGGSDQDDHLNSVVYPAQGGRVMLAFWKNTAHIPRIVTVRALSSVAAAAARPRSLDMIFLDGDHRYEAVNADIEAWLPAIRPGGIICGHDYGEAFPGVRKAVQEKWHVGEEWGKSKCFHVIGNVWWKEIG